MTKNCLPLDFGFNIVDESDSAGKIETLPFKQIEGIIERTAKEGNNLRICAESLNDKITLSKAIKESQSICIEEAELISCQYEDFFNEERPKAGFSQTSSLAFYLQSVNFIERKISIEEADFRNKSKLFIKEASQQFLSLSELFLKDYFYPVREELEHIKTMHTEEMNKLLNRNSIVQTINLNFVNLVNAPFINLNNDSLLLTEETNKRKAFILMLLEISNFIRTESSQTYILPLLIANGTNKTNFAELMFVQLLPVQNEEISLKNVIAFYIETNYGDYLTSVEKKLESRIAVWNNNLNESNIYNEECVSDISELLNYFKIFRNLLSLNALMEKLIVAHSCIE
jgi:hypothetical protein